MTNRGKCRFIVLLLLFIYVSMVGAAFAQELPNPVSQMQKEGINSPPALCLSIDECVNMALNNNKRRPASVFAVQIAEAQYRQALSGYWPQLMLGVAYSHLDKEPIFAFPPSSVQVPAQAITIPANTFAPFFPPQDIAMHIPPAEYTIPEQDVTLCNKDSVTASLNLTYPIYTGGLTEAVTKQAKCGLDAAKEESRRTDLQVIYDTKKMYYESVLARELYRLGKDILVRLQVTLELTEKLYQSGSGTVKKTDYLRNKTVVEGVRSALATLETNDKLAKLALANTMGLPWGTIVEPSQETIPFNSFNVDLTKLVNCSYQFNPDWNKMRIALDAAEAKIKEANSGHLPRIALTGTLYHFENSYDYGLTSKPMKDLMNVGVNLSLPLFDGFLTENKIKEAKAALNKLEQEQILLREGLALQVYYIFLQMVEAQKRVQSLNNAADTSEETRELNMRAYQEGLVETMDVLESQLFEAFMKAQYYKALYDHVENQLRLDFIIGKEVNKILGEK